MEDQYARLVLLLGEKALTKLRAARVAVFGMGGVGGHLTEALARCSVGTLDLFDGDVVAPSNLNRQIAALHSTLGMNKVDVMKARITDIDPVISVHAHRLFYLPENAHTVDLSQFDYIADAIDTVTAKIELIMRAKAANVPIISAMGAGNKLDPTRFMVTDISKTRVCPLARVMRHELKARGVDALKVVYSDEPPMRASTSQSPGQPQSTKIPPGSASFVPPAVGLIMASEIIQHIVN